MSFISKQTVKDINVSNKKVIVRVDFNVPMDENQNITDERRIVGAIPTIKYLLDNNAKVILVSHLGRPKNGFEDKFSMKPVAKRLSELLGKPVIMAADVIGDDAKQKAAALKSGEVMILENVRFHKEEEANDLEFSKELASLAEIYVNDAFGTAHRAHASTAGIAHYLPAVCGFLIQKEIEVMGKALTEPKRPFVAIMGGAKVADKIGVIENLMEKVDSFIFAGGIAYTFLKAMGYEIGDSLCDYERLEFARRMVEKAKAKGVKIVLPNQAVMVKEIKEDAESILVSSDKMQAGWKGVDIGPEAYVQFADAIKDAKTILWNGPVGVFEIAKFAEGTKQLAKAIAETDAISIIGGGDSAAAVEQLGYADKVTHVSTGGGATLEYLEGIELPGIAALLDKKVTIAAGNWKMNKTPSEAVAFVKELAPKVQDAKNEVVVGVPFVCIEGVKNAVAGTNIKVAAQNMHWEKSGAFTGEISAAMLSELKVDYVIIGHSERRQYFGETDETVNKKIHAAFANGITPIFCVGETLAQREQGITTEWVSGQVKAGLKGLSAGQVGKMVIAYEPIWAIGTGKTATSEQAQEVCKVVRGTVRELYNDITADSVRIQYGGSVTATTAAELFGMPDIDGGLVGGASLKSDDFEKISKS